MAVELPVRRHRQVAQPCRRTGVGEAVVGVGPGRQPERHPRDRSSAWASEAGQALGGLARRETELVVGAELIEAPLVSVPSRLMPPAWSSGARAGARAGARPTSARGPAAQGDPAGLSQAGAIACLVSGSPATATGSTR